MQLRKYETEPLSYRRVGMENHGLFQINITFSSYKYISYSKIKFLQNLYFLSESARFQYASYIIQLIHLKDILLQLLSLRSADKIEG